MKDFSIIIPHYNSSDKLQRLLKTIPERDNIEIIVVDDSSDNSEKEKMKEIKKSNLKIIQNEHKKGAGGARNTGLDEAIGKWLIFADADDYFLEDAFNIFGEYINSEDDIIFFSCTSMYEDTLEIAERHIYFEKLIKDYLKNKSAENENELKYRFGVPWSKMIRREVIKSKKIRFSEIQVLNDQLFSVKAAYYSKKINAVDKVVYCVTRNKGSLTTVTSKKFFEIKINEMFEINSFFLEKNLKEFRPHFAGFLITSKNFGIKYMVELLNKILKKEGKIFPRNFFKDLFGTFYLKKIKERISDKKYKS